MPLPSGPNVPVNAQLCYVALMTRGPRFEATSSDASLMPRHFVFLREQVEAGYYKVFGPLLDNADVAALVIMYAGSLEAARDIANRDPVVLEGRFVISIHPAFLTDVSGVRAEYSNA